MIGYVNSSVQLIKQFRELGGKAQILGNMALSVPSFLELGGESLQGTKFTVSQYDPSSSRPEVVRFVQEYQDRYGETPNFFAAFGYDAVQLVIAAMRMDMQSPTAIKDSLLSIRDFPGVLGNLTVGPTGDIQYPTRIVTNIDGKTIEDAL